MKRAALIAIVVACGSKPVTAPPPIVAPAPAPTPAPDAAPAGTSWIFDPIGDRQPDTARFVVDDQHAIDRNLELVPLDEHGYSDGVLTGIDVAYTAPAQEDPAHPHRVIWRVYADEDDFPADDPLATVDATVTPPNHIDDGQPVQWTHHVFEPPVKVHDRVWLAWESPGEIDLAFTSESLASVFEQDGYITPEGEPYWRPEGGSVLGTPFVRADFVDAK